MILRAAQTPYSTFTASFSYTLTVTVTNCLPAIATPPNGYEHVYWLQWQGDIHLNT